MLLVEFKARLKWNSANKKRYTELGYPFTKYREEFLVEVEHLTPTTRAIVYVECDYCGAPRKTTYKNYVSLQKRSHTKKDACENCIGMKIIETNNEKYGGNSPTCNEEVRNKVKETTKANYGVEYNTQSQQVRDKIKETVIEKYGVENVFQSEETKQKIIETNNEKYGVDWYTQTDEYKEKIKETNLEKYGVEYASQSDSFKQKVIETNLGRYGVKYTLQSKEIREKGRLTMFLKGTAPTSRQQNYIHSLIGGELNYPVGQISVDIAFPDDMTAIEYDGGGHWLSVELGNVTKKEFDDKERRRNYFLIKKGWRIIRFISKNDLLPCDDIIINLINKAKEYLIKNDRHLVIIDIDNSTLKGTHINREIEVGKLRRIYENQEITV